MKKFMLLGLTLLLMAALLMGCNEGDTPDETTVNPTTTAGDVTETPTDPDGETTEALPEETTAEEETTEDYFEVNRIEIVKPDTSKVIDMAVTDKGYDIYRLPEDQDWGYRYGVTYLYEEDGSTVHAYFACVGTGGVWDWISYRRSTDGGNTWTE